MAVEETTQQQDLTEGQDEQAELAAFAEGFEDEVAIEAPPPELDDQTPTEGTEEGHPALEHPPETPPSPPGPPAEPPIGDRLAAMEGAWRQKLDQAFGKMGGLERTLNEIRESAGRTPVVNGQFAEEDFKDLAEEYPELTKRVIDGFNAGIKRLFAAPSPAASPTESAAAASPASAATQKYITEEEFAARLEQEVPRIQQTVEHTVEERSARRFMEYLNPDWRTIVGKPDDINPYRTWLAAQPDEYQQTIASTWDPVVLHKSIQAFEKSHTPPPSSPKVPPKSGQKALLKAAVPPKGGVQAPERKVLTEEDGFHAGFNEE